MRQLILGEIDEAVAQLAQRRDETVQKLNDQLAGLEQVRGALGDGLSVEEARVRVRAIRRKALGADAAKRLTQMKTQDMRVRMRAPADLVAAPVTRSQGASSSNKAPSRIVVQGSLQRLLGGVDGRMVELLVDEERTEAGAGELCLLADLRAGLTALARELPEHDVLLGLLGEHLEQAEQVLRDLSLGGLVRARRFFEHDRELVGRLRAMAKSEGNKKDPVHALVHKLHESLERLRASLDQAGSDETRVASVGRELEQFLVVVHKELAGKGFAAARSLLFTALNRQERSGGVT